MHLDLDHQTESMSTPPEVNNDSISQFLPTCQRCRRLRRKCDTQLPKCRACHKAGDECTFYDHALKQALPRSYVQSLLTRISHLQAVKDGTPIPSDFEIDPLEPPADVVSDERPDPTPNRPSSPIESPTSTLLVQPSFDVVIPSTSTSGRSLYWGSSSVFALTVEILQHAVTKNLASIEDSSDGTDLEEDCGDDQCPYIQADAPDSDIQSLVHLYQVSLNRMYGFVDQVETLADLQTYLALRQQPGFSPHMLQGEQAHQYFRITMMCAISCANQARYRPQRTAESLAYFSSAVTCVEKVTSEASPASLQALLLLIVFCLFYPRKGDIWKLLDHACRLTIELGYHTETDDGQTATVESEAQKKLRRSTFWGLYAIERIVGQLFGRGSDLPEIIITTEYPSSLHTAISPVAGDVHQPTLQSMSIAHHYRLVYLRSEIFRTMYLPASPPTLGLDWLKERYTTLYQWRQELAVSDHLAGVATLTCDVGYDATICFLFQPLLLTALRATLTQEMETTDDIYVASDPFYSSINLVHTYEKIIRAPENSVLGTYPMTFMSAHYIYLASSTLLAHGLLRLDGRAKVLRRMHDCDVTERNTEHLDWGTFIDMSSPCLVLLAWCAERWPGMARMLRVYQNLFRRIVRELIRRGLVDQSSEWYVQTGT